ncbi:tetratricopeptide repeat protein 27-like isoform X1 [Vespa mandarinia]|uniref:tetratricopeptide repeat protein 27-like isoform X1 n=2 Tax=Vespa mandarinia TaxID=7446 RepID=UPI00160E4362|nr:tetratricopeptide repeat protein 27-like isoform X1 [Vespa mandarinia]
MITTTNQQTNIQHKLLWIEYYLYICKLLICKRMMDKLKEKISEKIETQLLTNVIDEECNAVIIRKILEGQYVDVLLELASAKLFESLSNSDDLQEIIYNNIKKDTTDSYEWLCLSIASLFYFIKCNWTGPITDDRGIELLSVTREKALKYLSLHDECNENVEKPEFLYLSKIIFSNEYMQNNYKSCMWWLFRANLLHQFILEETSGTIFEETEMLIANIGALNIVRSTFSEALFNLEVAQFYLYYKRIECSEKYLAHVENIAQVKMELQGIMGKRTKYQKELKPQLFLKISMDKEDTFETRICKNLPKSLDLNDDLRLERTQFSEFQDEIRLGALEEAIVLARHTQLQLSQPRDKLTDEEINPYVTKVIDNTKNWSLKMTALCCRCIYEANDKRTVERSMLQAEYLLKEIKDCNVTMAERLDIFFASGMKPIWMLEKILANIMLSLGLVKGALDLFLKLKLWEDVILCYNILELKHKAAEIILQKIAKKPTIKLWCLLGDTTGDVKHYETAWKLSDEKSSRAQRHWGFFYFLKKNYVEAIPHLRLSVELNNIQEDVWLRLGFAALQTEDWKLAAMAYRRYCALEQTTFEAWNNLAKAYIKLGDKYRAWKVLYEAIKCNHDRWEVWDNLMAVCIDLGQFLEVIRCYNRILDLKNEHSDIQILEILTNAIANDIKDVNGKSCRNLLLLPTLQLFGRITSRITNNSDLWRLYSELTMLKRTDVDDQKAMQYLQKAYRAAVSEPKWFQKENTTLSVLQLCCKLSKTYLHCSSYCTDHMRSKRALLGSAKLALQGVIKKVKDIYSENAEVMQNLQQVEEYFKVISSELEKMSSNSR